MYVPDGAYELPFDVIYKISAEGASAIHIKQLDADSQVVQGNAAFDSVLYIYLKKKNDSVVSVQLDVMYDSTPISPVVKIETANI